MLTPLQLWIIRWCDFKIWPNAHRKRMVSESQQSHRWQPLELVFLKFDWCCIPIPRAVTVSILGIHRNNLGISIASWRWGRWTTWRILHATTDSHGLWGTYRGLDYQEFHKRLNWLRGQTIKTHPPHFKSWAWSQSFFPRWKSWFATKEAAGSNR